MFQVLNNFLVSKNMKMDPKNLKRFPGSKENSLNSIRSDINQTGSLDAGQSAKKRSPLPPMGFNG